MADFLVVHLSLGAFGGAEKVCHYILKSLIEHGQKVELLSFEFNKDTYRAIIGDDMPRGIILHELPCYVKIKPPFTIYKRYYNIRKSLIKFQKENGRKYDFLFLTQSSAPFEPVFLKNYDKALGYVHFPQIHYEYERSKILRRIYLQPFKWLIDKGVRNLDLIICNSYYTKKIIIKLWNRL
ncbi:MAG: glycosyltransferase family 4 protein [Candidatus Bathyarchaeia archaeon]